MLLAWKSHRAACTCRISSTGLSSGLPVVSTFIYICVCVCVHTHTRTHCHCIIYIYIYIYTHTHKYIHIHAYTYLQGLFHMPVIRAPSDQCIRSAVPTKRSAKKRCELWFEIGYVAASKYMYICIYIYIYIYIYMQVRSVHLCVMCVGVWIKIERWTKGGRQTDRQRERERESVCVCVCACVRACVCVCIMNVCYMRCEEAAWWWALTRDRARDCIIRVCSWSIACVMSVGHVTRLMVGHVTLSHGYIHWHISVCVMSFDSR